MSSTPETVRVVVIRGRVQRVGFRAWVESTAAGQGLAGWVRNRLDGTVEALFAGSATAVETMIEACRRGPPSAQVETVEVRESTPDALALRHPGETFSVLPTA
jgi:acylphosphatase